MWHRAVYDCVTVLVPQLLVATIVGPKQEKEYMGSYRDTSGGSADLSGPFNLVTDDMYYVFS